MDLSIMYRFSGLPNNAQLEMVEAQKKRAEAEVHVMVQLNDGTRIEETFKSNASLAEVIELLCPGERIAPDLVVVYMRTEILADKLLTTSLKDLGLISGRAIFRVIHRDPDAAKM